MQTSDNAAVTSPLERRLEMSVPLADIDREVEQRLKRLSRTVKMAGFRPGKVPMKLVAQQYGSQVRSEAIGDAVQKAFGDVVREQKLRVAGMPRIQPRDAAGSGSLEFSAVFEVYPEFQLGDISAARIERPVLEVTDAEVDRTIEVLRKQRTRYEATDRPAGPEDRLVIDFTGRIDGEVFPGGQATDFALALGGGTLLPDFEAQLTGAVRGAELGFDLTFPADYHAAELAGKLSHFTVTVKSVEAPVLPEVDAEFARSLGIADGDLERMRSEVRANVEREVKKRIQGRVKEQVMRVLLEANPIQVPRALVEQEARQLAENARQDMMRRGMEAPSGGVEPSWFAEPASRRVRLGLLLAEVVKANDLHAQPDQVRAMVEDFAQSYEEPSEVVRWYYGQRQQLAQVEALVIEDNVVNWVMSRASVEDKPVAFDELMGTAA